MQILHVYSQLQCSSWDNYRLCDDINLSFTLCLYSITPPDSPRCGVLGAEELLLQHIRDGGAAQRRGAVEHRAAAGPRCGSETRAVLRALKGLINEQRIAFGDFMRAWALVQDEAYVKTVNIINKLMCKVSKAEFYSVT